MHYADFAEDEVRKVASPEKGCHTNSWSERGTAGSDQRVRGEQVESHWDKSGQTCKGSSPVDIKTNIAEISRLVNSMRRRTLRVASEEETPCPTGPFHLTLRRLRKWVDHCMLGVLEHGCSAESVWQQVSLGVTVALYLKVLL